MNRLQELVLAAGCESLSVRCVPETNPDRVQVEGNLRPVSGAGLSDAGILRRTLFLLLHIRDTPRPGSAHLKR